MSDARVDAKNLCGPRRQPVWRGGKKNMTPPAEGGRDRGEGWTKDRTGKRTPLNNEILKKRTRIKFLKGQESG